MLFPPLFLPENQKIQKIKNVPHESIVLPISSFSATVAFNELKAVNFPLSPSLLSPQAVFSKQPGTNLKVWIISASWREWRAVPKHTINSCSLQEPVGLMAGVLGDDNDDLKVSKFRS